MSKLITRLDDLGISKGVNYGILTAVQGGLAKTVGLMSNMKDASHGYNLIKDYPISIGIHVNVVLGCPVSNPIEISSLIENGNFKKSSYYRTSKEDTINYQEAAIEIKNQIQLFKSIAGKSPEYVDYHAACTPTFVKALEDVCEEMNLMYIPFPHGFVNNHETHYCEIANGDEFNISPINFFERNKDIIINNDISIAALHPGYVDSRIMNVSSLNLQRAIDLEYISSEESKEWLEKNHIELADFSVFK